MITGYEKCYKGNKEEAEREEAEEGREPSLWV